MFDDVHASDWKYIAKVWPKNRHNINFIAQSFFSLADDGKHGICEDGLMANRNPATEESDDDVVFVSEHIVGEDDKHDNSKYGKEIGDEEEVLSENDEPTFSSR